MDERKKIKIIADLFEVDENEIKPDVELETLGWDSMRVLSCLVVFKSKVKKSLSVNELRSFRKVKDIFDAMEE